MSFIKRCSSIVGVVSTYDSRFAVYVLYQSVFEYCGSSDGKGMFLWLV